MGICSFSYHGYLNPLPYIGNRMEFDSWCKTFSKLHPGQYVYIEKQTSDRDGDRSVNKKMMAKIKSVTMPRSTFFSGRLRGNLTLELPNGSVVDMEEERQGDRYFSKALLDALMETPTLGTVNTYYGEVILTVYDDFAAVKAIMESIQKEHKDAQIQEQRRKQQQLRSEQEQLRLEQEKEHLNREAAKVVDDLFRKL